jgi:anti-anti-sigma factor
MEIKVSTENGRVPVTVLHLDGNLDAASYKTFQDKAGELIKNGTRHILVDLSQTPFVSSAGLRAFHEIFNQLRAAGSDANEEEIRKGISAGTYKSPHLKLLNLSKDARTAFETAGFDMYIETFTDRQTAINSF